MMPLNSMQPLSTSVAEMKWFSVFLSRRHCTYIWRILSPVVHWLALWFRNPKVNPLAGSKPAEDNQGYELFGEI